MTGLARIRAGPTNHAWTTLASHDEANSAWDKQLIYFPSQGQT